MLRTQVLYIRYYPKDLCASKVETLHPSANAETAISSWFSARPIFYVLLGVARIWNMQCLINGMHITRIQLHEKGDWSAWENLQNTFTGHRWAKGSDDRYCTRALQVEKPNFWGWEKPNASPSPGTTHQLRQAHHRNPGERCRQHMWIYAIHFP